MTTTNEQTMTLYHSVPNCSSLTLPIGC